MFVRYRLHAGEFAGGKLHKSSLSPSMRTTSNSKPQAGPMPVENMPQKTIREYRFGRITFYIERRADVADPVDQMLFPSFECNKHGVAVVETEVIAVVRVFPARTAAWRSATGFPGGPA